MALAVAMSLQCGGFRLSATNAITAVADMNASAFGSSLRRFFLRVLALERRNQARAAFRRVVVKRDWYAMVLARAVFGDYGEMAATLGAPCQMALQRDGHA